MKLSRYALVIAALISIVALQRCEIINPEEEIPAWIEIDSFVLVDNQSIQEGALSHEIVDAWIMVDGNRVGTYELPCRIPILANGEHTIVVSPGILVSGITSLRDNYLYFTRDTFVLDLQANQTYKLEPIVSYQNSSLQEIISIEDFEDGDDRVSRTSTSNAFFTRTNDASLVKYGDGCGIMQINDTVTTAIIRTNGNLTLPQNGSVFLEVDCASDYYVQWGLYVNSQVSDQAIDIVIMKPTDGHWEKRYIALDDALNQAYANYYADNFYIYAKTLYSSDSLPATGNVRVDNFKILYVYE